MHLQFSKERISSVRMAFRGKQMPLVSLLVLFFPFHQNLHQCHRQAAEPVSVRMLLKNGYINTVRSIQHYKIYNYTVQIMNTNTFKWLCAILNLIRMHKCKKGSIMTLILLYAVKQVRVMWIYSQI